MGGVCSVRVGQGAYKIFIRNNEKKRVMRRARRSCENIIKINLEDVGSEDLDFDKHGNELSDSVKAGRYPD
jgi:hypothetical protein